MKGTVGNISLDDFLGLKCHCVYRCETYFLQLYVLIQRAKDQIYMGHIEEGLEDDCIMLSSVLDLVSHINRL